MNVLDVRGLRVSLGRRAVIDGADFSIENGITMLLGLNGCGKSTLIRALIGLIPSKGEILLDGTDARRIAMRRRARLISYLPQRQSIPPGTSLIDYVAMGASPALPLLAAPNADAKQRAMDELDRLGMGGMRARTLDTLSGGEARLAALARARLQRGKLMLMDEPLAGLDFRRQHEFIAHVKADKTPVLMSLHDPLFAWEYADRILIMENGRVAACEKGDKEMFSNALERIYGVKLRLERIFYEI